MSDPFSTIDQDTPELKKKRLWRNLFLLSLTLSIFLVGIFWLPIKAIEINQFVNQPSVNLPKEGDSSEVFPEPEPPPVSNIIRTSMALINASSETKWIYFNLKDNDVIKIHDPTSLEWDLAFRRGKVITNGGITNKFGAAGAIDLGEQEFDLVESVPTENYLEDEATGTQLENEALKSWYKYNYFTHKLTAKKNVYAIRTAKGKFAKVQFLSFYCINKETGCIKMQFVYQDNGTPSFVKSF
tara:strand:- start:898 stop:1620 length:723 start_codon:yes stop_codon:yes gene_type:complete